MIHYAKTCFILTTFVTVAWSSHLAPQPGSEAKAVDFLTREVPAWSKGNGCFSCHNNGDGARALYAAASRGYQIDALALSDTTKWVSQPGRWDENKGDPGFGDKHLANIQFAASLTAAIEAGYIVDRSPIDEATRRLIPDQSPDGSWLIEPESAIGSPATYGTPLATYMALKTLRHSRLDTSRRAVVRAETWLGHLKADNTITAATILLAARETRTSRLAARREDCLKLIGASQTSDGGWGPYRDSPPEAFDTALVLLALSSVHDKPRLAGRILAGRRFLLEQQQDDGGWAATTRPPGGESYAQRVSTTAWATLALLETR